MANRPVLTKVSRFFKAVYLKLFRIDDTPQRIASGLGLGVFMGVLPGTGPIAALALAFLLRVNRASALLGSLLTNTWLSIPVFLLSLKAGAYITGVRYADLHRDWSGFLIPIIVGYAAVSLAIGIIAYVAALIVVKYINLKKDKLS